MNVGRDDDGESTGRVSMFARLAVTSTAVRECHEVLDAFDGVRVSFDNGFAVVELVQESTFGSSSVC